MSGRFSFGSRATWARVYDGLLVASILAWAGFFVPAAYSMPGKFEELYIALDARVPSLTRFILDVGGVRLAAVHCLLALPPLVVLLQARRSRWKPVVLLVCGTTAWALDCLLADALLIPLGPLLERVG
ncbi:MAG: hypothetical protein L0323_05570 [Planctomycetes bacterium]|nr:hypothetical protein [Planctomycetota bacterium]